MQAEQGIQPGPKVRAVSVQQYLESCHMWSWHPLSCFRVAMIHGEDKGQEMKCLSFGFGSASTAVLCCLLLAQLPTRPPPTRVERLAKAPPKL